jgi:hypothetical protein
MGKKGEVVMNTYVASRALAAIDEIRGLLQAAEFAAQKLEQQVIQQEPVESLSDHIHRVKAAADMMRARILRSIRRAASAQLPDLAK